MDLVILTPEKQLFSGKVKSVKVPGTSGQFEVRNNHAPIVSSLSEGTVKITTESDETELLSIDRGFIEVIDNQVAILVHENP